eukprot:1373025-Amorphochlora_amoeboformis.AAC.1
MKVSLTGWLRDVWRRERKQLRLQPIAQHIDGSTLARKARRVRQTCDRSLEIPEADLRLRFREYRVVPGSVQ